MVNYFDLKIIAIQLTCSDKASDKTAAISEASDQATTTKPNENANDEIANAASTTFANGH